EPPVLRHRFHGAGAGSVHGARRNHHSRRGSWREISLCHPDTHYRRELQLVSSGHLPEHARRRVDAHRVSRGRAEKRNEGGRLRSTATGDRRCGTDRGTRGSRSRGHRVRDRRPHRTPALLRRERAFEFRGRSGARDRLQSLCAACGLPYRGSATTRSESQRARCGGRGPTMRYGYWLPVFGGWLRNVENENMETSWVYVKKLAQRSEKIGFDLTLIAELNLNDIKGIEAPSLDAWSTAAALAAVTERLELMVAVRPSFHSPAILAKQAANIDRISNGRLALNVVSAWWKDEARRFGAQFDEHDDRYARTKEWLDIVDGAWREPAFSYSGTYYKHEDIVLEPKPISRPHRPRPTIYAGGESEAAKSLIARHCDAYVMHGDPPERIAPKVADMRRRREQAAETSGIELPPMRFGVAAYTIVRDDEAQVKREVDRITNVTAGSPGYQNYQDWI